VTFVCVVVECQGQLNVQFISCVYYITIQILKEIRKTHEMNCTFNCP